MSQRTSHQLTLLIWWLGMTIGSHWPDLDLTGGNNDILPYGLDKWLHVIAFAGLSFGALHCFGRNAKRVAILLPLLIFWAGVDEWTQQFVNRDVLWSDFFASSIGVAAGALVWGIGREFGKRNSGTSGFVGHTRLVAALTLISRIFGLVRDWSLAFVFGLTGVLDAFVIAFMIPNLFRRLFGEGALAAAFIPQYTRVSQQSEGTAVRFARRVIAIVMIVVASICAIGIAIGFLLRSGGVWEERTDLVFRLTTVMIGYAPLICAVAIMGAVLQVRGRFGIPAASPIVLNLFIIGACLFVHRMRLLGWEAIGIVAGAVLFAGFVQFIWHWLVMPKYSVRDKPKMDPQLMADAKRQLLLKWGPTVFGLAIFQLNVLADSLIALWFSGDEGARMALFGWEPQYPMEIGSVAVLGAAARLYEFPLGVFGIALATAIYPALAAKAEQADDFGRLLRKGLRMTMFIGLPASVGMFFVREPLADAIYHVGGSLKHGDSGRVAWVLAGYAPAIWAYSMNHVLTRTFYAKGDTRTPVRVGVCLVAVNIALNLLLIWPLGAAGLSWSTAICAALQSIILLALVKRHAGPILHREVMTSWLKTTGISALMGLLVWTFLRDFDPSVMSRSEVIVQLLMATGLGAMVVFVGAAMMKMPETRWVLRGR